MATASIQRTRSSIDAGPILAIVMAIAIAVGLGTWYESEQHFDRAVTARPWLSFAKGHRPFLDHLRFAFTDPDEVAFKSSPAAVNGIDAVPLTFTSQSQLGDAQSLVAAVNAINPACAMMSSTDGACSDAAITDRHGRLERALGAVPLGGDYWIELSGRAMAVRNLILVTAQACSLTPYRTETAFLVKPVDGYGSDGATGWNSAPAGGCANVTLGKYRHQPKLFAYSRADDGATLGLLKQDAHYATVWSGRDVAWGGEGSDSRSACVSSGAGEAISSEGCALFAQPVSFRAMSMTATASTAKGTWLMADPGLCTPSCAWGASAANLPLAVLQQEAAELATELGRRQDYRSTYGTVEPFLAGITTTDDNGQYRLGVRVTSVTSQTPFGVATPFQVGDVITELDDIPIFDEEDLRVALAHFMMNTGADKSYRYQYWRYDPVSQRALKYEASGSAFFNATYWLTHGYDNSEVSAFMTGLANAFSFGFYRDAVCFFKRTFAVVPSYRICTIASANEWMLMRQLYPNSYWWGQVPAMVFAPIQYLLGVTGVTLTVAGTFVVEALESGLSTAAEMAPGQRLDVMLGQFTRSMALGQLGDFGTALINNRIAISRDQ